MNYLDKTTSGNFVRSGVIIAYDFNDNKISAKDLEDYTKRNDGIPVLSTTIVDLRTNVTYSLPNTTLYHDGTAESAKAVFKAAFENIKLEKNLSTTLDKIIIIEIGNKFGIALNKIL